VGKSLKKTELFGSVHLGKGRLGGLFILCNLASKLGTQKEKKGDFRGGGELGVVPLWGQQAHGRQGESEFFICVGSECAIKSGEKDNFGRERRLCLTGQNIPQWEIALRRESWVTRKKMINRNAVGPIIRDRY